MISLVYDSHCHLEHIQTLSDHSVPALIPGVNLKDIPKLLELRSLYQSYKIGFGLHPWFIENILEIGIKNPEELSSYIRSHVSDNLPDFIGEIGLDKYKPNFDKQVKYFETQLIIAKQFNLPIIVHCVKAYNEILSLLKNYDIKCGVIHGFNANEIIAKQFYEQGFLLGVGSHITSNGQLSKSIVDIPMEHIVLESDAPFMPAFGKTESLSSDCFLYGQILANKKNISLIEVINQSNNNILNLFN